MRVRCPSCGVLHAVEKPKTNIFENRVRRGFRTDALSPTFPQGGIATEQPAGLPSMDTHVKIPFRQTVIYGLFDAPTGAAIGLGAGLSVALLVDAASGDSLTFAAYALITAGGGLIGGTVSFCRAAKAEWPKRLSAYDALLWMEEVTGLDLDGDGEVGEPGANRVEVEIQEKGVPREIDTLDISANKLQRLAYLILIDKESFSERTAAKAGISREEEWVPFRDKLITRRWAKWKHPTEPKQGAALTPKGLAILRAVLAGGEGQINVPGTHPRSPTHGNGSNYERFEHIER
jgi:hypothetical protein